MMQFTAIIVAAGLGSRFKGNTPKQFIDILDKPTLQWSIDAFFEAQPTIELILVLHKNYIQEISNYLPEELLDKLTIVEGGDTRFESVKNGLQQANGSIVAMHDAARPLIDTELIETCFANAVDNGSAIPVVALKESIRHKSTNSSKALDRQDYVSVQTPQCFNTKKIKAAYEQPYSKTFTDCASVYEAAGNTVHLVEGAYNNIKITTPEDYDMAVTLLNARLQQKRNRL